MTQDPKYLSLTSALLLVVSSLSMTWNGDEFKILNQDDYAIAERHDTSALETRIGEEPHLESFNEWQCFSAAAAEIDCYDEKSGKSLKDIDPEERDGRGYFPTIVAERDGRTYVFEAPGWVHLDSCLAETAGWKNLIAGQTGFCVFAAKWPPNTPETVDETSDWVIYGLKSPAGRSLAPIYDPDATDDAAQGEEQSL